MTADWDEVKRLAADFQKAQLSSTLQRLSERNCVEIVQWLLQHHMVELIFTTDGKEYITPQHLVQEILGELYVQGGRVNLVELAKNINVDLAHINSHIPEVLRNNKDTHLVLGQLLDDNYIIRIAGEINEKLSQQGQISVNDLTISYDLPAEFLQHNVIEKQLGRIIQGRQDPVDAKVFFTEAFIARSKAKIRGALAGLTKPTPVTAILSQIGIQEKLFFSLYDQVAKFGNLTSRLAGAQYIPHVYSRSQNEWVTNFYKQNSYLEFDAMIRLGISDYKNYLKRTLANEETTILNSCIVAKRIIDQTEADVEECISSKSYIDIQNNLPSVFNEKDISMILDAVLTPQRQKQVVILDSFIISTAFIDALAEPCDSLLQDKAKQIVESGRYQQYQIDLQASLQKAVSVEHHSNFEDVKTDKREERRKKASGGKAGGGAQGRETKTKSTKKQTRGKQQQNDSDDEVTAPAKKTVTQLQILTLDDIKNVISPNLEEEGLDELIEPIALRIQPNLNEKGLEIAANLYASTVSNQAASRRKTHAALQDQLNTLLGDVRLFEKGAKMLPADVQTQLYKYLMKTLCTDITNEIIGYLSSEYGLGSVSENITPEQRTRLVNELPAEHKSVIQSLVKTLSGSNIEEFMTALDDSLAACSMILKKVDKKKDRVIILAHKHGLLEQLGKCEDPALVLHLATVVIFEVTTQNMIHASGRHVSSLLSYLKQYLTEEQLFELSNYHDMVMMYLSNSTDKESIGEKLKEKMNDIKNIATNFKKPTSSEK